MPELIPQVIWVIRKSNGELLKDMFTNETYKFFSSRDAFKYIDSKCGGSMYLCPEKVVVDENIWHKRNIYI